MKKKLFSLTVLILGVFLAFNLGRGVWEAYKNKSKIDLAQNELNKVQKENADLKKELEFKQSEFFVEKEARDKLNLAKKGETVVIFPQIENKKPEQNNPENLSNFEEWRRLFFGS